MKCPHHKVEMTHTNTRYGRRYKCPVENCTFVKWSGSTSTVADANTRAARIAAHNALNALLQQGVSKGSVYKYLQNTMKLLPNKCHIGMLDAAQCEKATKHLNNFDKARRIV